jgi:hypothetical protein
MRTLETTISNTENQFFTPLRQLGAEIDTFAIVADCSDVNTVQALLHPVKLGCKRVVEPTLSVCRGAKLAYQRMALVNGTVRSIPAGASAIQGYIEQLHGIEMCHKMIREHEAKQNFQYDYIVRTR